MLIFPEWIHHFDTRRQMGFKIQFTIEFHDVIVQRRYRSGRIHAECKCSLGREAILLRLTDCYAMRRLRN
jgi:hypothetical protein